MTTVKIELSDEQAASLKAKAATDGLTLEDWFQKLARQGASAGQPTSPSKGRYSLAALMAQCDTNAPLSAEDRAWMDAPVVGHEAL